MTHDLEHQRDNRYDQSELATAKSWPAETIDTCARTDNCEVADALSQLLDHEGVRRVIEVLTKGGTIDTRAPSALVCYMSEG